MQHNYKRDDSAQRESSALAMFSRLDRNIVDGPRATKHFYAIAQPEPHDYANLLRANVNERKQFATSKRVSLAWLWRALASTNGWPRGVAHDGKQPAFDQRLLHGFD